MLYCIGRSSARTKPLRRFLSSSAKGESWIPKPTWSLKDLKLSDPSTPPVSHEELCRLAKRATLDVESLPNKERLRQDLANMMNALKEVQDVKLPGNTMTEEEIYDVPRGVDSAPVRSGEATQGEISQSQQVWGSLLEPKTTALGGQKYFGIVTKRGRS